jgi:hypothetical protein
MNSGVGPTIKPGVTTDDGGKGNANFVKRRVGRESMFWHVVYVRVRCPQEKSYCFRTNTKASITNALPVKSIAVSVSPKANHPAAADKAG